MEMPYGKNDHVDVIRAIAQGVKAEGHFHNYLELGIRRGPTFNAVAPLAKQAFAVDNDAGCHKFIIQNKNLIWRNTTTDDFFKELKGKKTRFNLVFIDANHSHEASLNDFKNVTPFLADNAIVLLHDTYPPSDYFIDKHYCGDTYKTAAHIKRYYNKKFEIVTLPFYFGISIVRKASKQLEYK